MGLSAVGAALAGLGSGLYQGWQNRKTQVDERTREQLKREFQQTLARQQQEEAARLQQERLLQDQTQFTATQNRLGKLDEHNFGQDDIENRLKGLQLVPTMLDARRNYPNLRNGITEMFDQGTGLKLTPDTVSTTIQVEGQDPVTNTENLNPPSDYEQKLAEQAAKAKEQAGKELSTLVGNLPRRMAEIGLVEDTGAQAAQIIRLNDQGARLAAQAGGTWKPLPVPGTKTGEIPRATFGVTGLGDVENGFMPQAEFTPTTPSNQYAPRVPMTVEDRLKNAFTEAQIKKTQEDTRLAPVRASNDAAYRNAVINGQAQGRALQERGVAVQEKGLTLREQEQRDKQNEKMFVGPEEAQKRRARTESQVQDYAGKRDEFKLKADNLDALIEAKIDEENYSLVDKNGKVDEVRLNLLKKKRDNLRNEQKRYDAQIRQLKQNAAYPGAQPNRIGYNGAARHPSTGRFTPAPSTVAEIQIG